jgi:phage terminase large subunit-like protein
MSNYIAAIRDNFRAMTKDEQEDHIRGLSKQELRFYYKHPDIFLFDKQLIPGGDILPLTPFTFYLLRCGRSFGKTFAGSAWVANKKRQGARVIGLCGPTYDDVAKVMVPAILAWFFPDELAPIPYNNQSHQITFADGSVIYCYTSDKEIRGPNLEYLWCDEICIWADGVPEKIQERFEDITRAVRVGEYPQTLITSTPKNHPFFCDFEDNVLSGNPAYVMVQGSMLDNPTLPRSYIDHQIKKSGNRARQEIYGDLIRDAQGAYWTNARIAVCRRDLPAAPLPVVHIPWNLVLMGKVEPPTQRPSIRLIRTLIGFDPAVSKDGDECGIIVASLYSDGHVYIRADYSGRYDPFEWSSIIGALYKEFDAQGVVVEKNQGGNTLAYTLRSVNSNMNIIEIHTNRGKEVRAENASNFYSQDRVHHIITPAPIKDPFLSQYAQNFNLLEDQMTKFNIRYSKSPDRVDALGHVITELFHPTNTASTSSSGFANLPARH